MQVSRPVRSKRQFVGQSDLRAVLWCGIGAIATAAFALALWLTLIVYGAGLDDSYIFFVYARNLAQGNGWSFNPGVTSFGVSSVVWTGLLALPSLFNLDLVQASRLLSALLFAGSTALAALITFELTHNTVLALLAGLVLLITPSVLLVSMSGMDVISHIFILLLLTYCVARWGLKRPILLGALGGILFLSRPDGVIVVPLLFGSWLVATVVTQRGLSELRRPILYRWMLLGVVAMLVVLPWFVFLFSHTGRFVPLSYHAKLLSMPGAPETLHYTLAQKFNVALAYTWQGLIAILAESGAFGAIPRFALGLLWLVATLLAALSIGYRRQTSAAHNFLWLYLFMIGLVFLLPFEYGWKDSWWYGGYLNRYILPVLPVCQLLTIIGVGQLLLWVNSEQSGDHPLRHTPVPPLLWGRYVRWLVYAGLTLGVVWGCLRFAREFPGYQNHYRSIVTINEGYRRSVAEWLRANTPADAYIADNYLGIGVLGYYSQRPIVDAGGLAETTIIEFWNQDGDPAASMPETLAYFDAVGVGYFVGPPGLSEVLGAKLEPLVTIQNPAGDLNWGEYDFNTVTIYRYK